MIGSTLGPYRILGKLGEGGMGEVYRARDTKLDRDVAIKILPESFAVDADRVARFTREAKTLAALNHPHIAHVYDAGREGSTAFIAMELVEGPTLHEVISGSRRAASRGATQLGAGARGLEPNEAFKIARQIADALATAHEAGIVHRDLKPANIKVTDDGVVKVLDFGLARGAGSSGSSPGDLAATVTSPAITAMGVILGTASYMSPEQAKGKPVDRRADVWAFGVVLYEMLTGTFLFGREDVTDTLAAVLTHEPDLAKLPRSVPLSIKRLIERCLVKDKKLRLDSMTVARFELEEAIGGKTVPADSAVPPARGLTPALAAALAIAGVVVGVAGTSLYQSRSRGAPTAPEQPRVVSQLAAPLDAISAFHDGFALSADGTLLAFAARNRTGLLQIWLRRLDADGAHPVQGTDGGTHPFWAPGGKSFAFFADGKLKRVDIDGGRLQTICETPGTFESGSWNARDEILWAAVLGTGTRIQKISANGGAAVPFDALGTAFAPVWLNDGQRFLYETEAPGSESELRLASADGKRSDFIAAVPSGKVFEYGGGVLFLNKNDALVAQRLDEVSGRLVGSATPIAPIAGTPKDWFAVSSDGDRVVALVRQGPGDTGDPGDPMARLIWVDRQGNTVGSLGDPGHYWTLRVAPDGRSAVVNPGADLWLLRSDGHHTRLSAGGKAMQSFLAIFNRDASELVYVLRDDIVRRRLDPQSQPSILTGLNGRPEDWSNDGRWLFAAGRASEASTTLDILLYDFEKKTVHPWLATQFAESLARFSPDGKWVAYASDMSGRLEIYLRAFEGETQPIAVSSDGGIHPAWRADGNELFFLGPSDDVMSVSLSRSGATIVPGKPQRLFRIPLNDITRRGFPPYGVSPDGQRFLLNVPDRPTPLFFLQGLMGLLK
jgi:Tol biopolymer transport system component